MNTGMDILAANLPPRSITGALKKLSCEILQEYKDKRLYSGIVGYMDFGGSGNFSVNIGVCLSGTMEAKRAAPAKIWNWAIT
jgi:anthranilate/para-aminobenzoate synthase component I